MYANSKFASLGRSCHELGVTVGTSNVKAHRSLNSAQGPVDRTHILGYIHAGISAKLGAREHGIDFNVIDEYDTAYYG